MSTKPSDYVRVNDLALTVSFADGSRWPANPPHAQPVLVSFSFAHDVHEAADKDELEHSVNYSTLAKGMQAIVATEVFLSLENLVDRVCEVYSEKYPQTPSFSVVIKRTKALLYGGAFGMEVLKPGPHSPPLKERLFLLDLVAHAVVGIHSHERRRKQRVRVNVSVTRQVPRTASFDFRAIEQNVFDFVEASTYLTVEALASEVARVVLNLLNDHTAQTTVRILKPSAIVGADSAEVEVTRSLFDFKINSAALDSYVAPESSLAKREGSLDSPERLPHRAAIAIGANIGDRFANIERALRLLEAPGADLEKWEGLPRAFVVNTSFMYETAPMYVEDQPKFINCACMVSTDLEPRALLSFLKEIEGVVGRTETFRNGPRVVDLDIVTYDSMVMDTRPESSRNSLDNLSGELVIPHPRLTEREFVLRPLSDMMPEYVVPSVGRTVEDLLKTLMLQDTDEPAMYKVIPFPQYPLPPTGKQSRCLSKVFPVPPTSTYWKCPVTSHPSKGRSHPRRTYIMATLNATPDSFSDGSLHYTLPDALSYATTAMANGASIIDIGGYSTRPGAAFVSPEEELTRVVPVIQAIREAGTRAPSSSGSPGSPNTALISVDTFRWEVAEEAIQAGASCINDVCAFAGPEWPALASPAAEAQFMKMRQVARDRAVPVVLMHSRGPAGENKDYSSFAYAADPRTGRGAVIEGVRMELGERVERVVRGPGGVRRWLVIVDPGVGFSKTLEGNLEVLRDAASVVADCTVGSGEPKRNLLVGFPQLIGTSRKSFLGVVLQQAGAGGSVGRQTRPDERDWATAAAVSCAVQQGASIVRVHDVQHLADVVHVSSALYS